MTLAIRLDPVSSVHAFVIVLDSVPNHTRSRVALRVWASASGRGTSDSAFSHALSEFIRSLKETEREGESGPSPVYG